MTDRLQQTLRDLHWVIQSPSLLNAPQDFSSRFAAALTEAGTFATSTLVTPIESKTYRVGHYFEALVAYVLEHLLSFEIVARQQQVFRDERTIGEIDFLIRDATGELTHVETAVKFYLHFPGEHRSRSHFIGPNSADHFEAKINKLLHQQLLLAQNIDAKVCRAVALVKGFIFYHPESDPLIPLPLRLATHHLQGHWIYASEIDWFDQYGSDFQWTLRKKPYWLSPAMLGVDESEQMTGDSLKELCDDHFQNSGRPLLVSRLKFDQDSYVEVDRVFVVQDGWPHSV